MHAHMVVQGWSCRATEVRCLMPEANVPPPPHMTTGPTPCCMRGLPMRAQKAACGTSIHACCCM